MSDNQLWITGGAGAELHSLSIGGGNGLRGFVEISGEGTRLTNTWRVTIGYYNGIGETVVRNGAIWTVNQVMQIGRAADANTGSAIVRVDNGRIIARNYVFGEHAVFDITLHTGGTNAIIQSTGAYNFEIYSARANSPDSSLELSLGSGFTSSPGEVFTLVQLPSGRSFDGFFRYKSENIEEGDLITLDGFAYPFRASYQDNRFSLEVIPEPGALGLLALATGAFLVRRHKARKT